MDGSNPVQPLLNSLNVIIDNMETALGSAKSTSTSGTTPTALATTGTATAGAVAETAETSTATVPSVPADIPASGGVDIPAGDDRAKKQKKKKEKKPKVPAAPAAPAAPVEVSQYLQCDLRVGRIEKVSDHPEADGLYVLDVTYGDSLPSLTVCAGLRNFIAAADLRDRTVVTICNLKARLLRGVKSEAMILAGSVVSAEGGEKETVVPLAPPQGAAAGDVALVRGMDGNRTVAERNNVSAKTWDKVVPRLTVLNGTACYDGSPLVIGDAEVKCDLPDGAEIH